MHWTHLHTENWALQIQSSLLLAPFYYLLGKLAIPGLHLYTGKMHQVLPKAYRDEDEKLISEFAS